MKHVNLFGVRDSDEICSTSINSHLAISLVKFNWKGMPHSQCWRGWKIHRESWSRNLVIFQIHVQKAFLENRGNPKELQSVLLAVLCVGLRTHSPLLL